MPRSTPLKVLLMDAQTGRAEALARKLRESGFAAVEILRTPGASYLAETVDRLKPDLVIVGIGRAFAARRQSACSLKAAGSG